jgi:ABC-type polysaccharide/polyol phosphate transport system ATPase subunit
VTLTEQPSPQPANQPAQGAAEPPAVERRSIAETEGLSFTQRAAPDPTTSPLVIDERNLGVKYSLRYTRKTTLRESLAKKINRDDRPTEFWALREVRFKLVHGESLAVIGPNGAGKSTLLQVLAGIITPSEGEIDVRGAISSLLTLGAGFDQDLTGRENIWLAGAFMGIPHREMAGRIDGIVEFADIGQFIDAPIKTYSSGMRARLGFSIATSVDPDILLLDEVLATGDEVFRAKSKQRVLDLVQAAKAIVLVTHDMNWVQEFCNRAMLLEQGHVVAEGDPADVVKVHVEHSREARARKAAEIKKYGGPAATR